MLVLKIGAVSLTLSSFSGVASFATRFLGAFNSLFFAEVFFTGVCRNAFFIAVSTFGMSVLFYRESFMGCVLSKECFTWCAVSEIMQTYHAETTVEQDGRVILNKVPFPKGERVEVVIIPSREAVVGAEDEAWRRLAIESFFRDYDDRDSVYDSY